MTTKKSKGKKKARVKKKKKKKKSLSPIRVGLLVLFVLIIGAAAWAQVSSTDPILEEEVATKATVDGVWLRIKPNHVESLLGPPDRVDDRNLPYQLIYEYDFSPEEKRELIEQDLIDKSRHLEYKTRVVFRNDRVLEVVGRELVLPDGREAHFLESKKELMPLFDTSSRPGSLYWVGGMTEHQLRATFYKKRLLSIKVRDGQR